jgi:hypothetical protein
VAKARPPEDGVKNRHRHINARTVVGRGSLGVFHLYFVEAPLVDLIKIGITAKVSERMYSLQQGSPIDLRLLLSVRGTRMQEHALHVAFADERRRGEWFVASDRLRSFVRDLKAKNKDDRAVVLSSLEQDLPASTPPKKWKQERLHLTTPPRKAQDYTSQRDRARRLWTAVEALFAEKVAA